MPAFLSSDGRELVRPHSAPSPGAGPTNNLFRFNTASPGWLRLNGRPGGPPPPPRYEHGMTAMGATLFIFGGYGNAGECNRNGAWKESVPILCVQPGTSS